MTNSNKQLKIAIVVDDHLDKPNGVQQHAISLGQYLKKHHQVFYITSRCQRSDLNNVYSFSKLLKVRFNGNYIHTPILIDKKALKAFLNIHQFDILYVLTPYSPFLAGRIIKQMPSSTKIIASFMILPNNKLVDLSIRLLRRLLIHSFQKIDHFIANTDNVAHYFKKVWRLSASPSIIPATIDLERFKTVKSRPYHIDNRINLLFLGRLEERKGCLDLIKAINLLEPDLKQRLVCHIGGQGSLEKQAKDYAQKHNLTDKIIFHGFIKEADKPGFLASADISIFPSRSGESFGISLLEALAVNQGPVLAANNLGYQMILGQRSDDLIFAPKNPQTLTKFLEKWLTASEQKRQNILNWQKQHINNYDLETVVGPKLLKIFDELTSK